MINEQVLANLYYALTELHVIDRHCYRRKFTVYFNHKLNFCEVRHHADWDHVTIRFVAKDWVLFWREKRYRLWGNRDKFEEDIMMALMVTNIKSHSVSPFVAITEDDHSATSL